MSLVLAASSVDNAIGLVLAVAAILYLFVVLVFPERF